MYFGFSSYYSDCQTTNQNLEYWIHINENIQKTVILDENELECNGMNIILLPCVYARLDFGFRILFKLDGCMCIILELLIFVLAFVIN